MDFSWLGAILRTSRTIAQGKVWIVRWITALKSSKDEASLEREAEVKEGELKDSLTGVRGGGTETSPLACISTPPHWSKLSLLFCFSKKMWLAAASCNS
jgi:hypothetical protein